MRELNAEEKAIILKKEERMNKLMGETDMRFPTVVGVEYRLAFPRTTVCILMTDEQVYDNLKNLVIGIAMRAKNEYDIPHNGEVTAFVRAVEAL